MTADEKRAASIREVICVSPNPALTNGLRIVDTPGIGSTNPRHYEVARSAMRDCDAVLVLTTLEKPLSDELIAGVKKLAGEEAPNCVFIGTRKDQQQKKELPRQKRYFQGKLKNAFGRECLFEFVSAYQALEELAGRQALEGSLADFRSFTRQARPFLVENRGQMQAGKPEASLRALLPACRRILNCAARSLLKKFFVSAASLYLWIQASVKNGKKSQKEDLSWLRSKLERTAA